MNLPTLKRRAKLVWFTCRGRIDGDVILPENLERATALQNKIKELQAKSQALIEAGNDYGSYEHFCISADIERCMEELEELYL
jgi:hypothetical protein